MQKSFPFLFAYVFIGLFFCLKAAGSMAADRVQGIPEFAEMAPGLYRGGQPEEEGYRYLKSIGVKTVLNMRHESSVIEWGRAQAALNGLDYISLPWTIYGSSQKEVPERFFEVVEDPSKQPLFIHCRRGVERTGVMATLYYMHHDGLSQDAAYEKAMKGFPLKFRWVLFVKSKIKAFHHHLLKGR